MNIYQIYYDDSQLVNLEPEFIPFNNEGKAYPFNYEYAVFFELFQKNDWQKSDHCGALSWKFRSKTGLSGKELIQRINEAPEYDVYVINPFPELLVYSSVWEQGDDFHPQLRNLSKLLLQEVGYDPAMLDLPTAPRNLCYCNYWVANKNFWDAYIAFLTPIWKYILENDNSLVRALRQNADPLIQAPYLPFIFERLFSTFLSTSSFRVLSLPVAVSRLKQTGLNRFFHYFRQAINAEKRSEITGINLSLIQIHYGFRKLIHYHGRVIYRWLRSKTGRHPFLRSLSSQDFQTIERELHAQRIAHLQNPKNKI